MASKINNLTTKSLAGDDETFALFEGSSVTHDNLAFDYDNTSTDKVATFKGIVVNMNNQKIIGLDQPTTDDGVTNKKYVDSGLATKQDTLVSGTNIKTIASKSLVGSGDVALVKGDVGLGNVDNTSDVNKPVSTATQTALNLKANQTSLDTTNTNVTALQTQLNNLTIVQNFYVSYHQISVLLLGVATAVIKGKCSFKKGNNIYNLGSTNTALVDSQNFQVSQFGTNWRVYLSTAAANTTGTNLTATYTNGTKTLQSVDTISMSFPNTTTLLLTFRDNTTTPPTISFNINTL